MEIVIALVLTAAFLTGVALGWDLAKRPFAPHGEYRYVEVSPEEAEAFIDAYLRSRANHPSNRFRHPEMEEEDDC